MRKNVGQADNIPRDYIELHRTYMAVLEQQMCINVHIHKSL